MLLVAAGRTLAVFDGRRDEDDVFTITSSSSLSSSLFVRSLTVMKKIFEYSRLKRIFVVNGERETETK